MSAPATRQRMLRQVLVAVLDVPAPRSIRCVDEDQDEPMLALDADTADDARALAKALRLRDRGEGGQPHPLQTPDCWSGHVHGRLSGWYVTINFRVPFAGEFVDRWEAEGGFERHGTVRPEPALAVTA